MGAPHWGRVLVLLPAQGPPAAACAGWSPSAGPWRPPGARTWPCLAWRGHSGGPVLAGHLCSSPPHEGRSVGAHRPRGSPAQRDRAAPALISYSRHLPFWVTPTAGAHTFPVCCLASGVWKEPSRGSRCPQSPQVPRQLCKGTASAIRKGSKVSILSWFAMVWGWEGLERGEEQQTNSKCYFKTPNNPNYKLIYSPRITTSYQ